MVEETLTQATIFCCYIYTADVMEECRSKNKRKKIASFLNDFSSVINNQRAPIDNEIQSTLVC